MLLNYDEIRCSFTISKILANLLHINIMHLFEFQHFGHSKYWNLDNAFIRTFVFTLLAKVLSVKINRIFKSQDISISDFDWHHISSQFSQI